VETTGSFVTPVLELPARMEHGKDHFERALFRGRMLVDRYPAPIVLDRDRGSIFMKCDPDI
jgi:hypothetical protein